MAKNIIICSDGTGNTANKNRGTNVFKLFEMVDVQDPDRPQVTIYDDGVGTSSIKPLKMLGGAFGWGLAKNVRELYTALARVYEPGDHIYLFGFSRGAFTVRSLAGLITRMGILDARKVDDARLRTLTRKAWHAYRHDNRAWLERLLTFFLPRHDIDAFSRQHCHALEADLPAAGRGKGRARIRFIGVWDTVSAVGFPVLWVADFINCFIYRFKFPNYQLNPCVEKAAHALAIDDERKTFHPRLWDESEEGPLAGRIQQVWFAGVHSNVGGGYPKQGMSLVSLDWMLRQAENAAPNPAERIRFLPADRERIHQHANVTDKLYDSRAGLAVYYRYAPRDIHAACNTLRIPCRLPPWKQWPNSTTTPKIHASVVRRILQGTEGYAPGNLPAGMTLVDGEHTPCDWPEMADDYRQALKPGETSLLDRTRPLIRARQIGGLIFMLVTLIWFALSLPPDLFSRDPLAIIGYFFSSEFVKNLFRREFLWIYLTLGAAYAATFALRWKIQKVYAHFWHHLRRQRMQQTNAATRPAAA